MKKISDRTNRVMNSLKAAFSDQRQAHQGLSETEALIGNGMGRGQKGKGAKGVGNGDVSNGQAYGTMSGTSGAHDLLDGEAYDTRSNMKAKGKANATGDFAVEHHAGSQIHNPTHRADGLHASRRDVDEGNFDGDTLTDLSYNTYLRAVRLYTLVPTTTALVLVALFTVALVLNSSSARAPTLPPSSPSLFPTSLTPLIRPLLYSASRWSLAFICRPAWYKLSGFLLRLPGRLLSVAYAAGRLAVSWMRGNSKNSHPYAMTSSATSAKSTKVHQAESTVFTTAKTVLGLIMSTSFQEYLRLTSFSILTPKAIITDPSTPPHHYLYPYQHPSFSTALLLALGWATSEAIMSIFQGYEQLSYYQDIDDIEEEEEEESEQGQDVANAEMLDGFQVVTSPIQIRDPSASRLDTVGEDKEGELHHLYEEAPETSRKPDSLSSLNTLSTIDKGEGSSNNRGSSIEVPPPISTSQLWAAMPSQGPSMSRTMSRGSHQVAIVPVLSRKASTSESIEEELEDEVTHLVNIKMREEFEAVYGVPVIDIPVFIPILERVVAILLSIGITLVLARSYVGTTVEGDTSHLVIQHTSMHVPEEAFDPHFSLPLGITYLLTTLFHIVVSLLHTPPFLATIGLHSAAFVGLILTLGGVFVGLGVWGVVS